MVKHTLLACLGVMLCSCQELDLKGLFVPTGEGVQRRFEQSQEINPDLKAATLSDEASYRFYAATDPHIVESHRNLSTFNNALRNDGEASFGVVLGDCIGVRDNLPRYLGALAYDPAQHSFDPTIFHTLGNHDIFFNGWEQYRANIGPSVYWFEVSFPGGKDLFITLDTATGTLGRKQTQWFREFLADKRSDYRHCIIFTHTNFFYTDTSQSSSGNMPFEESIALIDFLGRHDVALVLQGHDHYREDILFDGVRYCVLGAILDGGKNAEYLIVDIGPDAIDLHWQQLSEQ